MGYNHIGETDDHVRKTRRLLEHLRISNVETERQIAQALAAVERYYGFERALLENVKEQTSDWLLPSRRPPAQE